ncbi:MAG: hypothetical protein J5590_04900 [Clostridia bacterium]|nr:hypothetical protein [Clostridia bacterium]
MKKKTISLRIISALLALSMMFVLSACGKKEVNEETSQNEESASTYTENTNGVLSPEEAAKEYMQAEKDGDVDKIYSLVPNEVAEYLINNVYDGDKESLIYEINEQCLASYLKNSEIPAEECGFEFISADDIDEEMFEETQRVFTENEIAEITDTKDATFKFWIRDEVQEGFIVQLVKIGDKWGVLPYYLIDRLA